MKKKYSLSSLRIAIAVFCISTFSYGATTGISHLPVAGVGTTYAPNVVLALSVEYPTAGSAYPDTDTLTKEGLKKNYIGYFDNRKCYTYQWDINAFIPTSMAVTENGYVGLCNNSGDGNEYSGNVMNFLTMSAIDIFRKVMTGGNRAYGTKADNNAYLQGDAANSTYLRRAYVGDKTNQFTKYIDAESMGPSLLRRLVSQSTTTVGNKNIKKLEFYNKDFLTRIIRHYDRKSTKSASDPLIVIQTCSQNLGDGNLESDCVAYGNHYKPEGLLQSYGRDGMRVAVTGYLLNPSASFHGGVLRARMKDLTKTETVYSGNNVYTLSPEWNTETGQFYLNPDQKDADNTAKNFRTTVTNSGVINYTNKFGDKSGYKSRDPGSELYYTSLRYLRNGGWKGEGSAVKNSPGAPYTRYVAFNSSNAAYVDGFPAIYDWNDPMRVNNSLAGAQCRKNTIIFVGDTNTHQDWDLPNFPLGSSSISDDGIPTQKYFQDLLRLEGISTGYWNRNTGSINSPAGMAGMAYWARTNDIRPDIPGGQHVSSFMVDVVENGNYKGGARTSDNTNSFYWAAKYGGFDVNIAGRDQYGYSSPNTVRSSWTDDPAGSSSIPFKSTKNGQNGFADGVPRNYAPANDPDKMTASLKKAFSSAGGSPATSQTAASFVSSTRRLDLTSKDNVVLQTVYSAVDWSGNVIAGTAGEGTAGTQSAISTTEKWRASASLNNLYHNSKNWNKRKVVTMTPEGMALNFSIDNAAIFSNAVIAGRTGIDAEDIIRYTLGDSSLEGSGTDKPYRERSSLLGTVVNSKVAAILPSSIQPAAGNCAYTAPVEKRNPYYAFASNEGMLHILNQDGNEIFAYLPSTALPKLYDYALPSYGHFYLNDGSPAVAELCDGNTARSYLAGSTGRGGRAVYALDVTRPDAAGAEAVLWEFNGDTDSDLGNTTGDVSLAADIDNIPIAVFSSGYWNSSDENPSGNGYLYIAQLNKQGWWQPVGTGGKLGKNGNYIKIPLGTSGVGTPFLYDSDNDGRVDRIYVGDQEGKVWRIDQHPDGSWQVGYNGKPLYTPDAASARPISGAPFVQKINGRTYVVVGTGLYFDQGNLASSVQNFAYGFFDDDNSTITTADLLKQQINPVSSRASGKVAFYTITENTLQAAHKGWRLQLLSGQSIAGAAGIRGKQVAGFYAARLLESDDDCSQNGASASIDVDVTTGGLYKKQPLYDTDGDGLINAADGYHGMMEIKGLITPIATSVSTSSGDYVVFSDGGELITVKINPLSFKPYVRRLSWSIISG